MELMSHSSTFLLQPENPDAASSSSVSLTYALIVLNQPLPKFTPLLWSHAHIRVCADGGANRLYDEMPLLFPLEDPSHIRSRYTPDAIKSDMDSVKTEVLDFYAKLDFSCCRQRLVDIIKN
ncbi:hypothetical protein KIW84_030991 [Lathyrus oleraceus]|uniref:Thiamin pyrophosphokinase catalytic domain-containing protein n=1 Tax=Pisum sativum TaxID=3888 RepID=A0A9D4XTU7_PEA|nr:hypothetical protein KIW84_030991 [Pisum sativum]